MRKHIILDTKRDVMTLQRSLSRLEVADYDLHELVAEIFWILAYIPESHTRWNNYITTVKRQVADHDGLIYEEALHVFMMALSSKLSHLRLYDPNGTLLYRYERMVPLDILLRRLEMLPAP